MIDRIAQLYAIEAEAKRASPEERLATLAALRTKQSKPVLDEIRTWLMTQRALPRSALGKAIAYTSGLWPGLVRFLAARRGIANSGVDALSVVVLDVLSKQASQVVLAGSLNLVGGSAHALDTTTIVLRKSRAESARTSVEKTQASAVSRSLCGEQYQSDGEQPSGTRLRNHGDRHRANVEGPWVSACLAAENPEAQGRTLAQV